jgi:hypothetical protein
MYRCYSSEVELSAAVRMVGGSIPPDTSSKAKKKKLKSRFAGEPSSILGRGPFGASPVSILVLYSLRGGV